MAPKKQKNSGAPRKGTSSSSTSSRRSHNNASSQPAKFGIQHFFGKFSQTSSTPSTTQTQNAQPTPPASEQQDSSLPEVDSNASDACDYSPIVTKQEPNKRMRFSPGMLIKQSQDYGGDEVTWKLSPVSERLRTVAKNGPDMNKILLSASKLNANQIRPCSQNSPSLAGKLEQWLSTPTMKALAKRSKSLSNGDSFDIVDNNKENILFPADVESKAAESEINRGTSNELDPRQHRKALLEILDQVENVLTVEGPLPKNVRTFLVKDQQRTDDPENNSSSDTRLHKTTDTHSIEEDRASNLFTRSGSTYSKDLEYNIYLGDQDIYLESFTSMASIEKPLDTRHYSNSILKEDGSPDFSSNAISSSMLEEPSDIMDSTVPFLEQANNMHSAHSNIHFLVLEVAEMEYHAKETGIKSSCKVLRLLNEESGTERIVHLCDEWFYSLVKPGDTVNVIGKFDAQGKCVIDHENNLLVVHPDLLISGSRVGTSFSCPRRAVLDERIKSTDLSAAALMGTMLHQVFQAGLVHEHPNTEFLEQQARVVLQTYIDSLYATGGDEKEAYTKLIGAIPTILNWINSFRQNSVSSMPTVDFGRKDGEKQLSISEVLDIEEMVWSPKYGLKGMVDASVQVNCDTHGYVTKDLIMPLEFKTGKGTTGQAAMEHRAQVILYTLLMSDRYLQNVSSGLLYYLHTNQTQGVTVQHADLIGLMMRRNEHATNMLTSSSTQLLPPMLKNYNTCQSCRHLDACTVYHKAQEGGNAESSGLGDLFNCHVGHLSSACCEFLQHWDRLIDLEARDSQIACSEIWRKPSLRREEEGSCLSSMVLDISSTCPGEKLGRTSQYVYCFRRKHSVAYHEASLKEQKNNAASAISNSHSVSLLERAFKCGDYVVLSTEGGRVAVARGVIIDIGHSSITLSLSHRLRLAGSTKVSETCELVREVWRIDKDEASSSFAIMRFNLLQLFVKRNHDDHRRQLIVDLEPPRFDSAAIFSQDPAASYIRSVKYLNDDQRRAIHKILSAKDYALILGMPGTGKTSTVVHAVKALLARNASILLTSYTNSAVDNLLLKLKAQGIDFIRLGRIAAIHADIQDYAISGMGINSVKELESRMNQACVVGVTCLGITHPLLANKKFDVCIVDEAGQITLPVCLGPIMYAHTFVLVGDHYQLPPLVRSAEARENGMGISLFRRLSEAHPQAVSALQCQYRMCAGVMKLSNALIYGNRLRCGSSAVADARLNIEGICKLTPLWLREALDPKKSVFFINTDILPAPETKVRNAINNPTEASILLQIIRSLVNGGVSANEIGVISPYNSQVDLIRRLGTEACLPTLEVHTIDKYQGRDKDCILVSFVRSNNQTKSSGSSLLADWHRINVAITRAKKKLIMIGSQKTLSTTPLLRLLIEQVEEDNGLLHLPKEAFPSPWLNRCVATNRMYD
eukprot:Gb_09620 [translate_table: standard]